MNDPEIDLGEVEVPLAQRLRAKGLGIQEGLSGIVVLTRDAAGVGLGLGLDLGLSLNLGLGLG